MLLFVIIVFKENFKNKAPSITIVFGVSSSSFQSHMCLSFFVALKFWTNSLKNGKLCCLPLKHKSTFLGLDLMYPKFSSYLNICDLCQWLSIFSELEINPGMLLKCRFSGSYPKTFWVRGSGWNPRTSF